MADKKYRMISQVVIENIIAFLDEIHLENSAEEDRDSMDKANFCNWAIRELINAFPITHYKFTPKKENKKRNDIIDEHFFDWELPKDMTDDEFEKLVGQFDGFLRGWEKEYNKKKPKNKKPFKPRIDDVAQHCTLEEISEMLKDDPELTPSERFDLYYEEHRRVQRDKVPKYSLDKMMKKIGITLPSGEDNEKSN